MTIIVYGPPACGKTRHALELARHFGCSQIVDTWEPGRHDLTPEALHLTNEPMGCDYYSYARCVAFSTVRFAQVPSRNAKFVAPRFLEGGAQ